MSRNHKARKNFSVSEMSTKIQAIQKNELDGDKRFMTLTFLGFYDKTCKYFCPVCKTDIKELIYLLLFWF